MDGHIYCALMRDAKNLNTGRVNVNNGREIGRTGDELEKVARKQRNLQVLIATNWCILDAEVNRIT